MTEGLTTSSCLRVNGSGKPDPGALSVEEAHQSVIRMDTMAMEAAEAVSGVPSPPIYRTYQARAATYQPRTKADIDTIVLHTPEGGTPGTLGVLDGTRAGFDFFLPPAGELYKCNDYYNYIAHQAGDWEYNTRSLGIEQWNFASQMHTAPEVHYDRLARLCAYLVETLDLAIRHAKQYGEYGFIYHKTVNDQRCDPTACGSSSFNMEMLLSKVTDLVQGKPAPYVVYRTVVASTKDEKQAKKNQEWALKKGFKDVWTLRSEMKGE